MPLPPKRSARAAIERSTSVRSARSLSVRPPSVSSARTASGSRRCSTRTPTEAELLGGRLEDLDGDVDVAAHGVRVRASLVCARDQLLCQRPIVDRRQPDIELRGEAETILYRADADPCGHDRVVYPRDVLAPGDAHHRVLKASRKPGGEELLGIGARAAVASHLGRSGEVDVDAAVAGAPVALAPTGRRCLRGVQDTNALTRRGAHRRRIGSAGWW